MPDSAVQQIEADIAETERLMTELRLKIALSQSAGEDTTESERRLQDMLTGWMLLQDQRQNATEAGPLREGGTDYFQPSEARRSSSFSKSSS
jgi:hypothetical protein